MACIDRSANGLSSSNFGFPVRRLGLCRKKSIGTPTEVAVKREVMEMSQLIKKSKNKCNTFLFTGSLKEGFRFKSSDVDVMYWLTNWKVIGDLSQFMDFQTSFVDVILMEQSIQLSQQSESNSYIQKQPIKIQKIVLPCCYYFEFWGRRCAISRTLY